MTPTPPQSPAQIKIDDPMKVFQAIGTLLAALREEGEEQRAILKELVNRVCQLKEEMSK